MATAIRTIQHEDRLSIVEHLTELRTRLFVCLAALGIAFGFCFWQNHALLNIINKPLSKQTTKNIRKGNGSLGQSYITQQALLNVDGVVQRFARQVASTAGVPAQLRASAVQTERALKVAVARVPRQPTADKPVTLGVGEPFTTTVGVCLIFALILSLPVILFELYGFLIPAFSDGERRVALPLMTAIPLLFACGVVFGYFIVVPAAVRFFQNFNATEFNVLVQAAPYYKFIAYIILAMGLIFQTPVAVLAVTRAGIVTPKQLAHNRRYAIVLCAAVAAFLPGDAITLLLETVPLYLLFEGSVFLARIFERRDLRRARRMAMATAGTASGTPPDPAAPASGGASATAGVQETLDHVDSNLH